MWNKLISKIDGAFGFLVEGFTLEDFVEEFVVQDMIIAFSDGVDV